MDRDYQHIVLTAISARGTSGTAQVVPISNSTASSAACKSPHPSVQPKEKILACKNFFLCCAHARRRMSNFGKCYPQKCVFLRIRAYPQKCLRRSDFWQKKAKLSRFFGEMPDQSCLYCLLDDMPEHKFYSVSELQNFGVNCHYAIH